MVLAQSGDAAAAAGAGVAFFAFFFFVLMMLLVMFAISVFICYLLWNAQKQVPAKFRKVEPNAIWLLLIPLFNLVWNFFVVPKIAESYKAYFDSIGRTNVGTCGREFAFYYCIAAICCFIPVLGSLAGLAGLVLLILFLIKIYDLKKQILPETGGAEGDPPARDGVVAAGGASGAGNARAGTRRRPRWRW